MANTGIRVSAHPYRVAWGRYKNGQKGIEHELLTSPFPKKIHP